MVMMEEIIGDLLLRFNCVIIPSFGGFVTKPVSAKIDFDKGTMTPPGKALLFNKQLINNDGLIISELAHRTNRSFEEAEAIVKEQIAEWNKSLQNGGRVEIERVGMLYLDKENNLGFEQDRFSNLLLQSFGLGSLNFVPEREVEKQLTLEKEQSIEVPVEEETKIIPIASQISEVEPELTEQVSAETVAEKGEKKGPYRLRRYIAAACILPIAFYSVWIPAKTDVLESGVISLNDFNPFYNAPESLYQPSAENTFEAILEQEEKQALESSIEELPDEVDYYTYKLDESRFIPVKIKNNNKPVNNGTTQEAFNPEAMNFIVGCFSVESNATNLVEKLRSNGMNARIVDVHNGLHRVSAGEAVSMEAMTDLRSQAESLGMRGWVLK